LEKANIPPPGEALQSSMETRHDHGEDRCSLVNSHFGGIALCCWSVTPTDI